MSWRRWLVTTCLLVLAVAVWLLPPGGEAEAHANLARANPSPNSVLEEPPARAAIWFTEPIEPSLSEVRVLDSRGARVDDANVLADRNDPTAISVGLVPLPDGAYTVAWKNVSTVDGHRVRGSFLFSIGQPISGAPVEAPDEPLLQSPAEPVFRWLILTGVRWPAACCSSCWCGGRRCWPAKPAHRCGGRELCLLRAPPSWHGSGPRYCSARR